MNTTEIKAKAFRAAVDLATVCKPCTYDNVLDITAIALGIEMGRQRGIPRRALPQVRPSVGRAQLLTAPPIGGYWVRVPAAHEVPVIGESYPE